MVLDAGEIVEFDNGKKLVQNEKSILKSMIDESKDKNQLYRALGGVEKQLEQATAF